MAYKQLCSLFSRTSKEFTQKNSQKKTPEVRESGEKMTFFLVEEDLIS